MHSLVRGSCPQEAVQAQGNVNAWHRQWIHSTAEMDPVLTELLAALSLAGYSGQEAFGIRLAMEEAIVNAIKHGHQYDADKQVEVRYRLTEDCLVAEIQDQGPGFDPRQVLDPLADENLDRDCGRGLYLMQCYMTWVRYNPSGNCVTMCKQRSLARRVSSR